MKPTPIRPLHDLLRKTLGESFARQGFASGELVTRWADIAGAEIAAHSEPIKIQWPRTSDDRQREPGTLVLRVEGPAALEIQHMSNVILERVNRFFGWQAVGKIALRQAPLTGGPKKKTKPALDPAAVQKVADSLPPEAEDGLRDALARLGAAVKGG